MFQLTFNPGLTLIGFRTTRPWRENNVSCSVARGLNISSTFLIKQEIGTHVQYTQTDTNRQETLTNGTVGKKSPLVKEAL